MTEPATRSWKRIKTSVTLRPHYAAALDAMTEAAKDEHHTEQYGRGRIIEEALDPYLKSRGINVEEYARKEGA
jgi:hypothetical protein